MKRKRTALIVSGLLITALLTGCTSTSGQAGSDVQAVSTKTKAASDPGYAKEMDSSSILTVQISVDPGDWKTMLANATKEEYISADITINGTTIKNVGIRPKGNSSLASIAGDDTTDRFSFKIKFDEYVDGQTWMGLDKMVLNSNFSDATSMKEYLSYDIMNYIGVDTPLYSYADIVVNEESWGFYLAVEDLDSGYLDRVYGGEGELYKPETDSDMGKNLGAGKDMGNRPDRNDFDPKTQGELPDGKMPAGDIPYDIPDGMKAGGGFMSGMDQNGVSLQYTDDSLSSYAAIFDNTKTKTDETDQTRVVTALKNLSEGKDLETYVDVDAVLRYFAAHTVVVNLDSYVSNMAHNYYLYEKDGQISILPWDYNLAFGGFQSGSASDVVNFPIDTPVSGVAMEDRPLLSKLLEVPEYLERYHGYLQEILDGYLSNGMFEQKVDKINTLIADHIKKDPSAFFTYAEYETAVKELKELGSLRAKSIQGQLDGSIPSTTEGQKADTASLIDATTIDLEALGVQNGGDNAGMPGGMAGIPFPQKQSAN